MSAEPVRRIAGALRRWLAAAERPGGDKPAGARPFSEMADTLKRASAALREAGIPHGLTGAPCLWVHGGPETGIDWDVAVPPGEARRAEQALEAAGLRVERPPEGWLLKAWDGDVLVDVILDPLGDPVEACLERADERRVLGLPIAVLDPTDVVVSMLLARTEQFLEYERLLQAVRPVRERIDWDAVRRRTAGSPCAAGFLALLEALGLIAPARGLADAAALPQAEVRTTRSPARR